MKVSTLLCAICALVTLADAKVIVLSHPYNSTGGQANVFDVLLFDEKTGSIKVPSPRLNFEMGRATDGQIVFTPDGKFGFVAQGDGSVGEFEIVDGGKGVRVLEPCFKDDFYASYLVVSAGGDRLYVVDSNWPVNGGGVYSISISKSGKLKLEGKLLGSKNARALALPRGNLKPKSLAVLSAKEAAARNDDPDTFLLSWIDGKAPKIASSVAAFPEDDGVTVSDGHITADGKFALFANNGLYSVHRVSVVSVNPAEGSLSFVQELSPFKDPASVIPSPFDNAAIVVCAEGDAIIGIFRNDGNSTEPFQVIGPLDYSGPKPLLPTTAIAIENGPLKGRVLVSELSGVRQVQFEASGKITDLGLTEILSGYEGISGAIGIQP